MVGGEVGERGRGKVRMSPYAYKNVSCKIIDSRKFAVGYESFKYR